MRLGIWKTYGSGGSPALPGPPEPQDFEIQAVSVPSFFAPDLDLGEGRRAVAGHGQLGVAVEHQLDRRAGDLGELGAVDPPAVGAELAAEAAAHVLGDHPHVGGRDAEPLGELRGDPRDRLRRAPGGEVVRLRPVADLAVGLQAVVGHDRHADRSP